MNVCIVDAVSLSQGYVDIDKVVNVSKICLLLRGAFIRCTSAFNMGCL